MTTVTVLAIIDFDAKPKAPLTRMMNERLDRFAADLEAFFYLELQGEQACKDLVVYLSYNSNYAIRWTIVNDVPGHIADLVAQKCANLGYISWKDVDLYRFK
uniref:hypothetical protein n=1 Tax=Pedobacter schmidteae TaxID=2201271 RepID=UPI000EB4B68F|nr:hypothetical protein [Pedobacter schmidteae]